MAVLSEQVREGGSPEGEAGVPANGGIGSDKVDRSCLPVVFIVFAQWVREQENP